MNRYLEFDIKLRDAEPAVWRRLQVRAAASFLDLHHAIQDACGWQNYHLFRFEDENLDPIAGIPDGEWGDPDPDAAEVRLDGYFPEHPTATYLYDFGDSWEHDVICRGAVELAESFRRRLLGGERAFPPEDCGGIPGYEECVRVARGGRDEEDMREWLGDWDPDAFDLDAAKGSFDR